MYCSRYDYEEVSSEAANKVVDHVRSVIASSPKVGAATGGAGRGEGCNAGVMQRKALCGGSVAATALFSVSAVAPCIQARTFFRHLTCGAGFRPTLLCHANGGTAVVDTGYPGA